MNKANFKRKIHFGESIRKSVQIWKIYCNDFKYSKEVKMPSKPEFIQYFEEYEQSHIEILDSLYLKILSRWRIYIVKMKLKLY